MANCMYCKAEIAEGSQFCSACGKKQVKIYSQTFARGKMSEEEFMQRINQWFAMYPKVANVKASIHVKNAFGILVDKYTIEAVDISYELFKGDNDNQYAITELSKFALYKTTTDQLLDEWKKKNPGATVVARNGGYHGHGQSGSLALGGIGANNKTQLYVLFKFNRKLGPGVPPPKK